MTHRGSHVLLVAGCLTSFAVLTLAAFLPDVRLWGINHLAFYPHTAKILLLVFVALSFAPPVVTASGRLLRAGTMDRMAGRMGFGVVLATGAFAVFIVWAAATRLLGDGELVASYVDIELGKTDAGSLSHMVSVATRDAISPLTNVLYFLVGKVSSVAGPPPVRGLVVAAAAIGGGYVFAITRFLGRSKLHGITKIFLAAFVVGSGSLALFFGYVENYTPLFFVVALYVGSCVNVLMARGRIVLPIAMALLAIALHVAGVLLLPSLAYILVSRRIPAGKLAPVNVALVALMIAGAVVACVHPHLRTYCLPLVGSAGETGALSPSHLLDMLNECLLLMPTLGFLLALMVCNWRYRKLPVAEANRGYALYRHPGFVLQLLVPMIIFLLLFRPELGMARDWDLFAVLTFPLALMLAGEIERAVDMWHGRTTLARVAIPFAVIGLVSTMSWVGVNAHEGRTIARLRAILQYDDSAEEYLYESLSRHYRRQKRIPEAIDTMNEAWERTENVRYLYNKSVMILAQGDTLSAVDGFRVCVERRPVFPEARVNLAICLYRLGELEELEDVCIDGIRLEAPNPYYHYYLGMIYLSRGDVDAARKRFMYCTRGPLPPDLQKRVDAAFKTIDAK